MKKSIFSLFILLIIGQIVFADTYHPQVYYTNEDYIYAYTLENYLKAYELIEKGQWQELDEMAAEGFVKSTGDGLLIRVEDIANDDDYILICEIEGEDRFIFISYYALRENEDEFE